MTSSKINFGSDSPADQWMVISDDVMGGVSEGRIQYTPTTLLFQGKLSLDNNGGFSSLRSPYQAFDLSSFSKIVVRAKGDGRTYGFTLAMERAWYRPSYKHEFTTTKGEWQDFELPLAAFDQTVVGRITGKKIAPSQLDAIIRMGIILSDKKEGSFQLEIDYIEFIP